MIKLCRVGTVLTLWFNGKFVVLADDTVCVLIDLYTLFSFVCTVPVPY